MMGGFSPQYTLYKRAMTDFDNSYDQEDELPPSKSAVKREAERLKNIGSKLLELPDTLLASIPMTEKLSQAIEEGRRIKSHEGLRRHKQYIGKTIREADIEAIEARLSDIENAHTLNTRAFHELEVLRDALIAGDNTTVGEVISKHPGIDTQKLRQLVRNAKKEDETNAISQKKPAVAHSRKLFRFLRDEAV